MSVTASAERSTALIGADASAMYPSISSMPTSKLAKIKGASKRYTSRPEIGRPPSTSDSSPKAIRASVIEARMTSNGSIVGESKDP